MEQEQFWRALQQICDPPADYLNKRGRHIMLQKKVDLQAYALFMTTNEGDSGSQIDLSTTRTFKI